MIRRVDLRVTTFQEPFGGYMISGCFAGLVCVPNSTVEAMEFNPDFLKSRRFIRYLRRRKSLFGSLCSGF
jgi:hypothetical protein